MSGEWWAASDGEWIVVIAVADGVSCMSIRTTCTLDERLAEQARKLGVNISAAARDGVATAVRAAQVANVRAAYERRPEQVDEFWDDAEAWGGG